MAMLHTVNKSPFEKNTLETCLRLAARGSSVLLIEDGIYGALAGTAISDKVSRSMEEVTFYVLGPDLKARGMQESKVLDGVKVVDYTGFVDLVTQHDNVQSWL